MDDRNDMAYWFPRLKATGVPVPRTELVTTAVRLDELLDGKAPVGFHDFISDLEAAALEIGQSPLFLRTGHGSDKHSWSRSCFVRGPEDLPAHVAHLVEWSALVDILGLPMTTWAVREFVPLWHTFTAFDGMPVAVERRIFIRDGKPTCEHGYWPPASIRNPSREDWQSLLYDHEDIARTYDSRTQIQAIITAVAPAFDGAWSLDVALARDGRWIVTDMAEADRSFHWPGCLYDPASHL